MRLNRGHGWEDMGPASARPYRHFGSLDHLTDDLPARYGCVVCNVDVPGGRVFCADHQKRYRFTPQKAAA